MFKKAATLALQLGAGILICSSCDNLASDCEYLKSCPQGGAGGNGAAGATTGGSSGNSSSGGSAGASTGGTSTAGNAGTSGEAAGGSSGEAGAAGGGGMEAGGAAGTAGQAGAAGSAGAGGAPPCDGACDGATPHCDPLSNQCVECLSKADCASPKPLCDSATHSCVSCLEKSDCSGATPLCDTATHTCVACLQQADCGEVSASRCDTTDHACKACTIDAHCSDIAGKGVCLAGTCVECTAAKPTACRASNGAQLVCDSLKHTCTTAQLHSAELCQPCVADAQCALGELCVLDTFGSGATQKSVGYFCHSKQGDTANGAPADCPTLGRPYVRVAAGALSIDGETADVCVLAISSCPARNEFRTKNCAPTGTPDDSLCGVSPPSDAKCVPYGAGYRCTMTCGTDDDCPLGFPCAAGPSPVCTL